MGSLGARLHEAARRRARAAWRSEAWAITTVWVCVHLNLGAERVCRRIFALGRNH